MENLRFPEPQAPSSPRATQGSLVPPSSAVTYPDPVFGGAGLKSLCTPMRPSHYLPLSPNSLPPYFSPLYPFL